MWEQVGGGYLFPYGTPPPDGFDYFDKYCKVVGSHHYWNDAAMFIGRNDGWIELRREPGNAHDPNAIQVLGCTKGVFFTRRRVVGYVPRGTAKEIANAGLFPHIRPRLMKLSHEYDNETERQFLQIVIELLITGDVLARYKADVRAERKRARSQRATRD